MLTYADRVFERSTTTGTGTYSLAGAEPGMISVVTGIGTGKSSTFCATDGINWETFIGTVTAGSPDTLTRDTILKSSNSNNAVNWAAGTRFIFLISATVKGNLPDVQVFTNTGANTWTKPAGARFVRTILHGAGGGGAGGGWGHNPYGRWGWWWWWVAASVV
jgi:hypothetical protein